MNNEEVIKKLEELCEVKGYNYTVITDKDVEALHKAIKALKNEPKKGEWIHYLGCGVGKAVCSECGQLGETKKYCGNCGARMRGGYS